MKSLGLKVTLPLFKSMKKLVSFCIYAFMESRCNTCMYMYMCMYLTLLKAGVTIGDPVLRTGKPLSVELGPGKYYCSFVVSLYMYMLHHICNIEYLYRYYGQYF